MVSLKIWRYIFILIIHDSPFFMFKYAFDNKKLHNLKSFLKQKNIYFGISKGKVAFSWILNMLNNITCFFFLNVLLQLEWSMLKKGMFDELNV
jgi:hypothetical protein